MTNDEIAKILEGKEAEILSGVEKAVMEAIKRDIEWKSGDAVSEITAEFFKDRIAPKLMAHLIENEGAITKAINESAVKIAVEIGAGLVAKAQENMAGYRRDDVIKSLFGLR